MNQKGKGIDVFSTGWMGVGRVYKDGEGFGYGSCTRIYSPKQAMNQNLLFLTERGLLHTW